MTQTPMTLVKDAVGTGARLLLAITFIWACVHKIMEPHDFALQVATYQILPLYLVNLQALILPMLELVIGVLLLAGLWTSPAALVTCGLNLMFIVAIALALSAELHLQCGCFASADAGAEMDVSLIYRDIGLFIVGAYLVFSRPDRLTLDTLIERKKNA